ncbi:hypothetical protein RHGRI_014663 [Rhododendron griersonianum]|uniref:hAT-like transposase RNase-H fold domain-containing protein n=1 Tax=Rhododendron griersonianum TaxID=479676 RepID=A0AAV6KA79_9ERIC|nr:hypothetical protein RHGRI_014663 [Rhododendron griersonianum]
MKTTTPHWQKISRATAKNDCTSTYQAQKKKLKTSLKHVGRLSITTDLWKAPGQRIQYMVVTGHYVDEFWKLRKRVLSFCNVPPPHNGVIISDALYKCLVDWEIENKVATITINNASYNDVALKILKSTFHLLKKKLPLDVEIVIEETNLRLPTRWNLTFLLLFADMEFKDVFLSSMAARMKAKFDKYWGECNLVMALGAALDPRYKLVLIGFCFPEIYGDKLDQNIAKVRNSLYDLYDEYVVMHSQAYNEQLSQQSSTKVCSLSSASLGKRVITGKSKYESFVRKADTIQLVNFDLDIYLEESVYICASQAQGEEVLDSNFDALEWWKANILK